MKIFKVNNNIRQMAVLRVEEKWSWINFFVIALAILVSFAFVRETMFGCVQVVGSSMYSTLEDEDYLLLDKRSEIKRGDVIVFYDDSLEKYLIKRVIGLPGDIVWTEEGIVHRIKAGTIDKEIMNETYIDEGKLTWRTAFSVGQDLEKVLVEKDMLFVLGDNRTDSMDSRVLGAVPICNVQGVVHQSIIDNKEELWLLYKLF